MRRRDIELMAALADGSLEDETEARELIAGSAEHRAEYEAQLSVIEALSSVESAQMTRSEKTSMHQHIWSTLRAHPEPKRKAMPWYFRLGYAAVGLLVVVGLLNALDLGGADSASDGIAAEMDESLTADLQEAPKTTEQATRNADAAEAGEDTTGQAGGLAPDTSLDEFLQRSLADSAEEIRAGELPLDPITAESFAQADVAEQNSECVSEAGLIGYEALTFVEFEDAEHEPVSFLVALPQAAEVSPETPVVFIRPGDCTIVFTAE